MTIAEYFEEVKTKDIICWGSGKHFRNITAPFLRESGLIQGLKGFMGAGAGAAEVVLDGMTYGRIGKEELAAMDPYSTVILIAVTGYEEILAQLRADARLSAFLAVPSIYLESLYADMQLLAVDKPPLNYRKHDMPIIPRIIHAIWFSGEPMPELYQRCLLSWKKYATDMEIKIWDLETYKPDHCLFFEQAIEHRNWSFASDYARADLLRRYGGVYMDLDVEMLRPIADLLYNDRLRCYSRLRHLGRFRRFGRLRRLFRLPPDADDETAVAAEHGFRLGCFGKYRLPLLVRLQHRPAVLILLVDRHADPDLNLCFAVGRF